MLDLTPTETGFLAFGSLPAFVPDLANRDQVWCQECRHWHYPEEDWRCPSCSRLAAYSTQPHTCELCGREGQAVRCGHNVRSLCLCHETTEQKALRNQFEARSRHEVELQRQREQMAAERLRAERDLGGQARACWDSRGRSCNEPKGAYPECRYCVRWRSKEDGR